MAKETREEVLAQLDRRVERLHEFYNSNAPKNIIEVELGLIMEAARKLLAMK